MGSRYVSRGLTAHDATPTAGLAWPAACIDRGRMAATHGHHAPLDFSRCFLPEALAGLAPVRALGPEDRKRLNQIRAASYLHLFDMFESALGDAARERAAHDVDARELLAPLIRLDAFDHCELFRSFEEEFARTFPVRPRLLPNAEDLTKTLAVASPLALLVLALHLKLVTQQHYLACVRGDEGLEPRFVRVLKDHWSVECGTSKTCATSLAIQRALASALPGRIPAALRDYRLLVFTCDDVLARQAALDVSTLELARDANLGGAERKAVLDCQVAAHRKTFLTVGIVNAAFVYAMRSLGPSAPAMLAGVVSALANRR